MTKTTQSIPVDQILLCFDKIMKLFFISVLFFTSDKLVSSESINGYVYNKRLLKGDIIPPSSQCCPSLPLTLEVNYL